MLRRLNVLILGCWLGCDNWQQSCLHCGSQPQLLFFLFINFVHIFLTCQVWSHWWPIRAITLLWESVKYVTMTILYTIMNYQHGSEDDIVIVGYADSSYRIEGIINLWVLKAFVHRDNLFLFSACRASLFIYIISYISYILWLFFLPVACFPLTR